MSLTEDDIRFAELADHAEGARRLSMALLERAMKDALVSRAATLQALEWLSSREASLWLDLLDLSAETLKGRLIEAAKSCDPDP